MLFLFCKDLIEMMSQVVHVVANEILERRRFALIHQLERDLVQIMTSARLGQDRSGYNRSDVMEVQVVRAPELDQLRPRLVRVFLRAHPFVLFVTREHQLIRELRAHESLMIIRRGIDQMPEDLDRRPIVKRFFLTTLSRRYIAQTRRCIDDGATKVLQELSEVIFWGHGS